MCDYSLQTVRSRPAKHRSVILSRQFPTLICIKRRIAANMARAAGAIAPSVGQDNALLT